MQSSKLGQIACILGSQWGDEGKGKLVDILAAEYDIVARFSGGANAGHTIYITNTETGAVEKFIAHLLPSGFLHEGKLCVIGNGMVVHLPTLLDEVKLLKENGYDVMDQLYISDRAHLIFDYHLMVDEVQETIKKDRKLGTTKRGIGPAYSDKISRVGIRACNLRDTKLLAHKIRTNAQALIDAYGIEIDIEQVINKANDYADLLAPRVTDTMNLLYSELDKGKTILIEGAQGTMLDIDHGTYPYVTSSNTTIGGVATGLGIDPKKVESIIGIVKAYTTRVGEGIFPTELTDKTGELLREKGGEYGATTGRPRRCGWLDAKVVKYSALVNGLTHINLTKLDVLSGMESLKIGVKYLLEGKEVKGMPASLEEFEKCDVEYIEMQGWEEDISKIKDYDSLPINAKLYVEKIEELVGVPISFIGNGVNRDDMIER